ncbi:uncharacterized protein [Pocillopora verrucosa]|uniref:uncharacterized protein n=1 Tax=Pocillopora verrucosa TaxID=203993 RepID=UPI002796EA2B|nr:uncharacterized protein LOC131786158 [Pocillopora verrucosa]
MWKNYSALYCSPFQSNMARLLAVAMTALVISWVHGRTAYIPAKRLANTVFDANKNDRSDALVGDKDPFWARSEGDELEYDGNYDSSVEENKSPFQRNYRVPYENADEDVIPRSTDRHENNDGIFEMRLRSASHEGMNDTPFKRARIPVPCSMCCKIRRCIATYDYMCNCKK